ncbi:DUF192 domain-containing protein [Maribacter sp. 2210JD10-5]|uniref:DUF192 domain-containing protein n=1 Tax=Maribacter sp. 2210JD10-5 TaxID=3386272 RepID=UPI0039BCD44A
MLVSFTSCKEEAKKVIKTEPIAFTKEGSLKITKSETDSIIAQFDIEIAETDYETQTGLMYRKGMETDQGMLFIFPDVAMHSFYMKNTLFPLDIVYIDEHQKIVSFQENAEPFNENGLSSKVPVKYVLEINAGLVEKWSLEIGDTIAFERN